MEEHRLVRTIAVSAIQIDLNQLLDVKLLCTIVAHLDVEFGELPEFVSKECVQYRFVELDIIMLPNGNTLDFRVYFQNRRLAMV